MDGLDILNVKTIMIDQMSHNDGSTGGETGHARKTRWDDVKEGVNT